MSQNEPLEPKPESPGLALKIGIASIVALGAVASGFALSRQGRRVMKEAWQGRRRSRLEDRILETLWDDDEVGRRPLDVHELSPGVVAVSGEVISADEREHVLDMIEEIEGVREIEDRLVVVPRRSRALARSRIERKRGGKD